MPLDNDPEDGLRELRRELWRRTNKPKRQVAALGNLLIGILGFGCLPIWYELANLAFHGEQTLGPLRSALGTFFPALIGTTFLGIVTEESDKRLKHFGVGYGIVFFVVAFVMLNKDAVGDVPAICLSGLSSLAAVWLWWIANADNPAFSDKSDPQNPVGGPTSSAPIGSLEGFQH